MKHRANSFLDQHRQTSSSCCLPSGRLLVLLALLSAGALLGACASGQSDLAETRSQGQSMAMADQPDMRIAQDDNQEAAEAKPQAESPASGDVAVPTIRKDLWRVDRQGAVEVAVQPLEVTDEQGGIILFEVAMNTHSVDLSMDLSTLSTLSSDLGETMSALSWTGGSGHHVGGYLSFPLFTQDGASLFEGSQTVTLTIENVDAQERVFEWNLAEMLQ